MVFLFIVTREKNSCHIQISQQLEWISIRKKKKCRLVLVYNTKGNCLLVVFNEVKMEED
jgi:hypothetical protein